MSAPVGLEGSVCQADLERLVAGDHHDPHQILGPHLVKDGDGRVRVVIRGWRPDAAGMAVLSDGARIEMRRIHAAGVFAGVLAADALPAYRLESTDRNGTTTSFDDPYGCWPTLGEMDLHLMGEGRHEGLWRHLGAIVRVHQGLCGTVVCRLGAERHKRARCRGLQRLGRPGSPDAGAGQLRRLGDLPPGSRTRGPLQVRGGQPGRAP